MLDLDAIEARADKATAYIEGGEHDIFMTFDKLCELADDIPALVAELRAAREAKERVLDMHSSNSGGWCWECAHPSPCRTVTALAAYRAVVGPA